MTTIGTSVECLPDHCQHIIHCLSQFFGTGGNALDVTFDQLAAHIEHWLDLGGENIIALGGDWDGAAVPTFLSDASKMPEFQNMLSRHFGKTVMQKLCSDNALAFFERY